MLSKKFAADLLYDGKGWYVITVTVSYRGLSSLCKVNIPFDKSSDFHTWLNVPPEFYTNM